MGELLMTVLKTVIKLEYYGWTAGDSVIKLKYIGWIADDTVVVVS